MPLHILLLSGVAECFFEAPADSDSAAPGVAQAEETLLQQLSSMGSLPSGIEAFVRQARSQQTAQLWKAGQVRMLLQICGPLRRATLQWRRFAVAAILHAAANLRH